MNINDIVVKFLFEFRDIDGRLMSVQVSSNKETKILAPSESGKYYVDIKAILPCDIDLKFDGKNNNTDTKVDENNNIVEDNCVIIGEMWLDQIKIKDHILQKIFSIEKEDGTFEHSNYVGFNGKINVNLSFDNVFSQVMVLEKMTNYK